jgi:hypothetical protein
MFTCDRCGYRTKYKANLIKHLKTIKPCVCTLDNKDRENIISGLCNTNTQTHTNTVESNSILDRLQQLEKRVQQLESCNAAATNVTNSNIITNSDNNVINNTTTNSIKNINITLNLGNESFDHVPADILYKCLLKKELAELMKIIHFDEKHPENHNLRHKNRDYLEYYNDGWTIGPRGSVIDEWFNKGAFRILKKVYLDHKEKIIEEEGQEQHMNTREWLIGISKLNGIITKDLKPKLYSTLWNQKYLMKKV